MPDGHADGGSQHEAFINAKDLADGQSAPMLALDTKSWKPFLQLQGPAMPASRDLRAAYSDALARRLDVVSTLGALGIGATELCTSGGSSHRESDGCPPAVLVLQREKRVPWGWQHRNVVGKGNREGDIVSMGQKHIFVIFIKCT